MSEPSSQEPKDQPESNPLDLSDLQSFSFGTQWTDAGKKPRSDYREGSGRGLGQGRRSDRRPGGRGPARDRRPPRRSSSDRPPRGKGGPRGPREGGDRRFQNRGPRGRGEGGGHTFDRPYESAVFDVGFYPDDSGFTTIIKALRTNHITYELFEVAKIFLEKPDRFVASVTRKAAKGEKPERVFVSIPDGMPFETEEEAIQHAVAHCAESFFDTEEVEVEAPSGNFQFVNRCGITKKLLGPPNYHRYEEFVNQHHKTQLGNMPFEKFKASIEQVREEEAVNEWLESMKTTTRYTSKPDEGEEAQTFESLNDAVAYLRTSKRDKIVRTVNYARVSGLALEKFSNTEASKAVAGELARQRRFPLETANAIRGRLRREKFSIYKRGSKGVTMICSTRRNFRTKGQVMSESLDRLIRFLEAHQNIKVKEMPPVYEAWLKEASPETEYEEKKLFQDLHWLIADGYVSHFGDDSLFVQPVLENEPKAKKAPEKTDAKPEDSDAVSADTEPKAAEDSSDSGSDSNPEAAEESEPIASVSDSKASAETSSVESESSNGAKPDAVSADEPNVAKATEEADQPAEEPTLDSNEAIVVEPTPPEISTGTSESESKSDDAPDPKSEGQATESIEENETEAEKAKS